MNNVAWLKSKGILGGLVLVVMAAVEAWRGVTEGGGLPTDAIELFGAGLAVIGIRARQGRPG